MDLVRQFLREKSRAQLTMIVALIVNFVSQFFYYFDDAGSAVLGRMTDTNFYTTNDVISPMFYATGWDFFWHAPLLLVLAFVFLRDDIVDGKWFRKWGWWVSLAAFFLSIMPAAFVRAPGGGMAGISLLIAIAAVWLHFRDAKAAAKSASESGVSQ